MAVGYVLINVTPGIEIAAYNSIKSMENVDDITVVFGDYDLLVKLVADDLALQLPRLLLKLSGLSKEY